MDESEASDLSHFAVFLLLEKDAFARLQICHARFIRQNLRECACARRGVP
jgi:hypothetical protein